MKVSELRWKFFDLRVALVRRTKVGLWIESQAWYDGWEQRSLNPGPNCPDDLFKNYEGPI